MSITSNLSVHEAKLLKLAVPYAQQMWAEEQRFPTQEELKRHLSCAAASAKNLQKFLVADGAVKVANRLEALPGRAETKAIVQNVIGDTSGTLQFHILRENARLVRALAKKGKEKAAAKEVLAQEIRAEIEELKEIAKEELVKIRKPQGKAKKDTGILCEIACPDLHVGKLAHSSETGRRPYDVKIAISTFNRALDGLLSRTSHLDISEFLFVVGNDLLHIDSEANTTTSGTAVDCDGRFFKTFIKTREMIVQAIEKLRRITKVRVQICRGNHDHASMFSLGDSLECYFHNDPLVTIVNSPAPRSYVEWGNVLLGFCHGHEGKHSEYAGLMAAEVPDAWGRTKFREWHLGHFHRLKTEEYHGTRVRILSALTEADNWHANMGFIGAIRQAQAFIWSKKEGLLSEVFWNEDAQEPIITRTEIV